MAASEAMQAEIRAIWI